MNTSVLDRLVPDHPTDAPSRRWIADQAWPTNRDEAWRYAPLSGIVAAVGDEDRAPEADRTLEPGLAGPPVSQRVGLGDGTYEPGRSTTDGGPAQVVVGTGAARW